MGTKDIKTEYKLEIPLDASSTKDSTSDQPIKVVVKHLDGSLSSQTVNLTADRQGVATFTFSENPGPLRIAVGPNNASDEELLGLKTINLDLSGRQWLDKQSLKIPSILIPPYHWYWWLKWCREFTIRGVVLCPDGSPVPGATVCAYDVDKWWWWISKQQVGCGTTDATGAFEIKFKWCCGWWPWWWWKARTWQLEPMLAEQIMPVLHRDPTLPRLPTPSPDPTLAPFEQLLEKDGVFTRSLTTTIDLSELYGLRSQLLRRLPVAPELERLHIWPWAPWRDCTPDIIFRVTQDCPTAGTVIVDENFTSTRWDIPTDMTVTLIANNSACCIPICHDSKNCPTGNCMVISQVCYGSVSNIGGNPEAPLATPTGYANPGGAGASGDRPYAGVVPISGVFGDAASVEYYEFEWTKTPAVPASWLPMPHVASSGFTRQFWGPQLPAGPLGVHNVPFSFVIISGRNVIKSREYFETTNAPATWGMTRFWMSNLDMLMVWLTENNFADGTYYLRVKGWDLVAGNLINPRVLPLCNTNNDNGLVLTIDNRLVGPASGHGDPLDPNHRCGTGTVHTCTLEPDTDFTAVKILTDGMETPVGACTNVIAKNGGTLEIDFMVYDPDGHLAYYTLIATYGENLMVDLLAVGTLSVGAAVPPVPAALQIGPNYGAARVQGAIPPVWKGGMLHLSIPIALAFPESCCYQLELRAYKRTIVSCYGGFGHDNLSEFTFGVTV